MLTFYLGTHRPHWLAQAGVPLCVSRRQLSSYKTLPRACAPWVLDSGGFTELQRYGSWTVGARQYANEVRRYRNEVGMLEWAAPQDWMCEPVVIRGGAMNGQLFTGTGLSVAEHQRRTVANYLELRFIAPDLPIRPVIQGDTPDDYLRCADLYERHGVSLAAEPVAGIGSVCRLQGTAKAERAISALQPIRLHGFGVKTTGLSRYGTLLASADSMAWSYNARRNPPLPGCAHKNCANCQLRALWWRDKLLAKLDPG